MFLNFELLSYGGGSTPVRFFPMSHNVKRSRNIPMFVRPTVELARFITNLFLESILHCPTKELRMNLIRLDRADQG